MSKHVEMIIDYVVDGDDFQYNDNHGRLVRCGDCEWRDYIYGKFYCDKGNLSGELDELDYCSKATRRKPNDSE